MKSISFTTAGLREWRKLPEEVRRRIHKRLTAFAEAGVGDVKRLQGLDGAGLRVGEWRVIFVTEGELIVVTAVGHRRDIYE